MFDFQSNPVVLNIILFMVAAGVVWFAGTHLARYANEISEKTGLSKAFVGVILLAMATSLPELATTITATSIGNAPLAVNNLFGGIVLQTAVLAITDFFIGRQALTRIVPNDSVLLQGALLVILLALGLVALLTGPLFIIASVSIWSVILLLVYVSSLYLTYQHPKNDSHWKPTFETPEPDPPQGTQDRVGDWSLPKLGLYFAGGSVLILATGYVLSMTADALATQTGLGPSFIGATLLAAATSLPEVSTTISAARIGSYTMAISNIFGSNALMVMMVFIADIFYREGPILEATDQPAMLAVAVGIVVTAIYLVGILERKDRTILRMGIDSCFVLVIYVGQVILLYSMRG